MRHTMKKLIFVIFDFMAWPVTFLVTSIAMLPVAFLATHLSGHVDLIVVISLIPVYYFIWLFSFLALSSLEMSIFGLFFRKPRSMVFLEDMRSTFTSVVLHNAAKRLRMVWSMPFIETLLIPTFSMPFITKLVFKSYTLGKIRIGRESMVYTFLADPDLVEIGDNVVIGANASLISHAVKTTAEGKPLYLTNPIVVDHNATIGSEAFISMGTTISKNALVLAKSYVEPNTLIRENEVWGGNPAKFVRHRTTPSGAGR